MLPKAHAIHEHRCQRRQRDVDRSRGARLTGATKEAKEASLSTVREVGICEDGLGGRAWALGMHDGRGLG